jgi:polyphenol oxidase
MLIEAPSLSALPGIRHAFFTREGGASAGLYASLNGGLGSADDPGAVAENRRRMADHLGVASENLVGLYQVHSADAVAVEAPWTAADRPRADAMATRSPGLALGIATADCGPVLFADAQGGVVGAAHAGWKGALGGVLDATLARMAELGADRTRIVAVLGPTIGRDNYEVGPEFFARFVAVDGRNRDFFRPSAAPEHHLFDLPGFIGRRMAAAGIASFTSLDLCTYADEDRFYSYRRSTHRSEPDYGRLISAITVLP